jgi:chaperone modulatory protein CbpM
MRRKEFLLATRLEQGILETWLAEGWLSPRSKDGNLSFSEIDVARVQLIRDLAELGVNDESIPIVLNLVDQVHGLRWTMRQLLVKIRAQPGETRRQILPVGTRRTG